MLTHGVISIRRLTAGSGSLQRRRLRPQISTTPATGPSLCLNWQHTAREWPEGLLLTCEHHCTDLTPAIITTPQCLGDIHVGKHIRSISSAEHENTGSRNSETGGAPQPRNGGSDSCSACPRARRSHPHHSRCFLEFLPSPSRQALAARPAAKSRSGHRGSDPGYRHHADDRVAYRLPNHNARRKPTTIPINHNA